MTELKFSDLVESVAVDQPKQYCWGVLGEWRWRIWLCVMAATP